MASAKFRSLRATLLYVGCAPRALVSHVPHTKRAFMLDVSLALCASCPTYSLASRVSCFTCSRASCVLRVLVPLLPHVSCALRVLMLLVHRALRALVLLIPHLCQVLQHAHMHIKSRSLIMSCGICVFGA